MCEPQAEASALGGFAMAGEWTGSRVRWDEMHHIHRSYVIHIDTCNYQFFFDVSVTAV